MLDNVWPDVGQRMSWCWTTYDLMFRAKLRETNVNKQTSSSAIKPKFKATSTKGTKLVNLISGAITLPDHQQNKKLNLVAKQFPTDQWDNFILGHCITNSTFNSTTGWITVLFNSGKISSCGARLRSILPAGIRYLNLRARSFFRSSGGKMFSFFTDITFPFYQRKNTFGGMTFAIVPAGT